MRQYSLIPILDGLENGESASDYGRRALSHLMKTGLRRWD